MIKKRIYGLLLFVPIFCFSLSNAQTLPNGVNFQTPEVSAINKAIETPVSYYSGVPNISIPLYEIKVKDITVPVTLDYHAGGIRVDQDPTWVGLGWSLNYGGQITRKVRGAPDEKYYLFGANNSAYSVNYFNQLPMTDNPDSIYGQIDNRMSYITQAKYGNKDYMPDEFYYSAL